MQHLHTVVDNILLSVSTLEVVLLCASIGESYTHQFSLNSIMLLTVVKWNLRIVEKLGPLIKFF